MIDSKNYAWHLSTQRKNIIKQFISDGGHIESNETATRFSKAKSIVLLTKGLNALAADSAGELLSWHQISQSMSTEAKVK